MSRFPLLVLFNGIEFCSSAQVSVAAPMWQLARLGSVGVSKSQRRMGRGAWVPRVG